MKGALRAVLMWMLGLAAAQAATITIVNMDGAGEGLNDPASFAPTGGNNANTLGAARLNVLNEAARIWGLQLGSPVTIVVEARFDDLECSTNSGVLGSAGPMYAFAGFSGSLSGVLYPAALADAITGQNLGSGGGRNDIGAQFNSRIAGSPSCLGGLSFYLGFDHQFASNQYFDLLNVVLHEFAHGLGVFSYVDENGASYDANSRLSIYDQFVYSEAYGEFWPQMTPGERAASSISGNALVWNGVAVNSQVPTMSAGLSVPGGHLKLYAPTTWDEGSSVSHWDTSASPNLLMEPFLTANPNGLTDLTGCALRDMGWPGTRCPDIGSSTVLPTAYAQSVSANEDVTKQLTLMGYNPTGGALTYMVIGSPANGVLTAGGALTSNNGVVFTYTPTANVSGTDSFTFQVTNSSDTSSPATVTINIAAVNDAPVATAGSVSTTVGAAVAVTLSANDIESSVLTYAVTAGPAHGALTGTAPALTYTPNAGFTGSDSFTFKASDGTTDSNAATFSISVTGPASSSASTGGGGGGGSLDLLTSAMLLLLVVLQGWRRVVASTGRTAGTDARAVASGAARH